MNITVKKDENTGEYYIDVNDLVDLFEDVSQIEYYTMDEKEDGSLLLEFFDKQNNNIKPKLK